MRGNNLGLRKETQKRRMKSEFKKWENKTSNYETRIVRLIFQLLFLGNQSPSCRANY